MTAKKKAATQGAEEASKDQQAMDDKLDMPEAVMDGEIETGGIESGDVKPDEAVADGELASAQKEIVDLKDKLLRSHAEMENLRKRTERQIADAHKFGIEKFAAALLDVVDNLERALDAEEGNEAAVRQGIELTLNSWHEMMNRFDVKRIDATGQTFDPHQHEALSQMPSDEPEGTVIAQHVAGYTLHGRLIRPAKVLVSSGPAK